MQERKVELGASEVHVQPRFLKEHVRGDLERSRSTRSRDMPIRVSVPSQLCVSAGTADRDRPKVARRRSSLAELHPVSGSATSSALIDKSSGRDERWNARPDL